MQYRLIVMLVTGALFVVGCVHVPPAEKQTHPQDSASLGAAMEESSAESVYRAGLEKYIGNWNERIDALISSVDLELKKIDELTMTDLAADEQRSLGQRKRLLLAYQKKLQGIKEAQNQLSQKDDVLDRESVYVQLITRYVACLRIEKKLREDIALAEAENEALKVLRVQYRTNNYSGVVERFEQLSAGLPSGVTNVEARTYYALSLNALGRTDESVAISEALVAEGVSVRCANAALMYEIGEILIDAERYNTAEKVFNGLIIFFRQQEELSAKAKNKAALFQSDLDYLRVRNKLDQAVALFEKGGGFAQTFRLCQEALRTCPDERCRREVYGVLEQFVVKTAADMDRTLNRVDILINEGKILEAYELVISFERDFPDDDYPALIRERLALMKEKQELVREEEIHWKDKLEQQKYDKAIKLLQSEQYEEAIRFFDQLEGTKFETDARKQKTAAIDLLARSSRTKAGQLFLQAKQTQDPDLRKTYLIESYTVLKSVMEQYPHNQYADRIARNLDDVRAEIEKMSPEFFADEERGTTTGDNEYNLQNDTW